MPKPIKKILKNELKAKTNVVVHTISEHKRHQKSEYEVLKKFK